MNREEEIIYNSIYLFIFIMFYSILIVIMAKNYKYHIEIEECTQK